MSAPAGGQIAILDYGMGNLRSVEKAFEKIGEPVQRVTDAAMLADARALVVPGVGAFGEAMTRIRDRGFAQAIDAHVARGTPVLGICLGMQLILESSVEMGGSHGLGLLPGEVTPLDAGGAKVPHMGWAPVSWSKDSALSAGLAEGEPFYFVHSFAARPSDPADILGKAAYGETFACAVERGNVYGVQFHPEKSSAAGLRMLRNFGSIASRAEAGATA